MRCQPTGFFVLLLALVFMGAPHSALAQGGLGLKGGLSFGNVSNTGVLPGDLESRTGFTLGVSGGTAGSLIGFGADVLYAQRGLESKRGQGSADRRIDYVDVPAYLRVGLPLFGLRPFAHAGPQISLEVSCRTGREGRGRCPPSDRPSTTFAGVIGAGLGFAAGGNRMLTLEGRYIYGVSDLKLSELGDFEFDSESFQDRSFVLIAGVRF